MLPNVFKRTFFFFPTHTLYTHGDAHTDDNMLLLVMPNVTNVHASDISPIVVQFDAQRNTPETYAENTTSNDETEPSNG
jgi:hypothetical protein